MLAKQIGETKWATEDSETRKCFLVREAGGFVSEIEGGENPLETGSIVAGNEPMIDALRERLGKAG